MLRMVKARQGINSPPAPWTRKLRHDEQAPKNSFDSKKHKGTWKQPVAQSSMGSLANLWPEHSLSIRYYTIKTTYTFPVRLIYLTCPPTVL